jgi:hypothetical protein
VVDLSHSKGTLLAGGELVHFLTGKNVSEHQIIHLELPTMYGPLVIAQERLTTLCILESCFSSSLINEVNIITPELVLCDLVM